MLQAVRVFPCLLFADSFSVSQVVLGMLHSLVRQQTETKNCQDSFSCATRECVTYVRKLCAGVVLTKKLGVVPAVFFWKKWSFQYHWQRKSQKNEESISLLLTLGFRAKTKSKSCLDWRGSACVRVMYWCCRVRHFSEKADDFITASFVSGNIGFAQKNIHADEKLWNGYEKFIGNWPASADNEGLFLESRGA